MLTRPKARIRFAELSAARAGIIAVLLSVRVVSAAQAQSPLAPSEEQKMLRLADTNLTIELVAAEPEVRAPVAVAWDGDGRMFVAEMTDYPSGPVSGRIRLLEDRDGDGHYEINSVFATNLAFPNGVMAWKNGVLVTAAPDIWFLADTNGDGVADVREKVLTGFTEGNQQLRVNGLFWGIDNWIYGANGRSDGEARWGDDTTAGSIRRHDFRFRLDTKEFEAIAGNSQFGMGHDDWGNRFPVFNNTPIRYVALEERYLSRQPLLAGKDLTPSISPTQDGNRVFALTPPALLIPQPVGFFTSACGPSVYRGTTLPPSYLGNYFVCEPVQNVVQRRVLMPNGSTFVASYANTNQEFLAATDPWFHGVFTTTGPDGALYVVDFYRQWVEHPHWVAPELRDKVEWRRGEEHGRIWKIYAKGKKPMRGPRLLQAGDAELVNALENDNGWVRDTAHRLLVERQARKSVPGLEKLANRSRKAQARLHSLYVLQALRALSPEAVESALEDSDPRVREHAIRLAEDWLTSDSGTPQIRKRVESKLSSLSSDKDARVRLQLAATLGQLPDSESHLGTLERLAGQRDLDDWQVTAILASAGQRSWSLLSRLKPLIDASNENQLTLLEKLTTFTVKLKKTNEMQGLAEWIAQSKSPNRLLLTGSFAEALPANRRVQTLTAFGLSHFPALAATAVADSKVPLRIRVSSVRLLAAAEAHESFRVLNDLLSRSEPEVLQSAAVKALLECNDTTIIRRTLEQWPECSRTVRRQMIAACVRQRASALALLDAVEAKKIPAFEIDPPSRQTLEKFADPNVRERTAQLLHSTSAADREAAIKMYGKAAEMDGDRKRGAAVFERLCVVCHQMQGVGAQVGPDLSGIGTHSKETLLVDILDPSRQVLPDFVSYTATTRSGDVFTGYIVNETPASVTLRRPNEPDITLQRPELQELKTESRSVMPDGLEAGLTVEDVADLLEFLRLPDRTLFSGIK